ncbi:TIGR03982 family His-Xaa-Ser system protein [Novosphingopyxis sp.]|uniref:TIGR03982 family His-Xaa-Ser system protein n=1 Tax=Novosphingopyxis sp. TaxID=2709690 RepID=UPI003B58C462
MIIAWSAMPLWREIVMASNQDDYGLLVEQCDGAMQDHFRAKRTMELDSSISGSADVASAEIGLIVCQDYDIYQKRLMQWGLRESELAQMRLKAVEANASDLEDVVDTHEIRF